MRATPFLRSLGIAAVALAAMGVGATAGAAGQALVMGVVNDGGSAQTVLSSSAVGASFTLKDTANSATGIFGWSSATAGSGRGVYGRADSPTGKGVSGVATATSGSATGVHGTSAAATGSGVFGQATAASGNSFGVVGEAASEQGVGVLGDSTATSGVTYGAIGRTVSPGGTAVAGLSNAATGGIGVMGSAASADGIGVMGTVTGEDQDASAVFGWNSGPQGTGVMGWGATGVHGMATQPAGTGVHADGAGQAGAVALEISGGAVKVANGPAFVADPSSFEICENLESFALDSPFTNGDINAIVLVTPRSAATAFRVVYEANAGTACNAALTGGRWVVETPGSVVTTATEFNVWVVNR